MKRIRRTEMWIWLIKWTAESSGDNEYAKKKMLTNREEGQIKNHKNYRHNSIFRFTKIAFPFVYTAIEAIATISRKRIIRRLRIKRQTESELHKFRKLTPHCFFLSVTYKIGKMENNTNRFHEFYHSFKWDETMQLLIFFSR